MIRAVVSSSSLVRRGRLMMWRCAPTSSTVDSLMAFPCSGARIHAGQKPIRDGDLAPAGHAELLTQDVGMRLHRTRRDAQLLADLLIREACRDELDDLTLAVRERRCSLRERVVHAAGLTTCCTGATFVERSIRAAYFF